MTPKKRNDTLVELNKILQVSNRVRMEHVRIALGLSKKKFLSKIFAWAGILGFVIDGDYLELKSASVVPPAGVSENHEIEISTESPFTPSNPEETKNLKIDDFNAALEEGRKFRDSKQFNLAIKMFERAIEINPKKPAAWRGLGTVYHKMKDFNQAIKMKKKALDLNKKSYSNWMNLGYSLQKAGLREEAGEAFAKAVICDPKRPSAWRALAYYLKKNGDKAGALYCWDKIKTMSTKISSRIEIFRKEGIIPRCPAFLEDLSPKHKKI